MLALLTGQLRQGSELSAEQIVQAVTRLILEDVAPETKAEFLMALATKGETASEIAAFAAALRDQAVCPPLDPETRAGDILDVCGTGGDRQGTFNISTTVAIVAAAANIPVAKHGNRAITSQAGSADVLEALGIRIDLPPDEAARSLREHHFAFFFAPNYHPAFKHIGPARRLCAERGQRTIFNFLGPLLNPARPTIQLMGVPQPDLCAPLARVLQSLGVRRALVVCGRVEGQARHSGNPAPGPTYLDELSTLGETHVAEFHQGRGFAESTLSPALYPVQPAQLADLAGGDRQANARIVRAVLAGEERGPKRDAVLLNTGAALFIAAKTRSIREGWDLAGKLIDSGRAKAKLAELVVT